MEEPRFSFVARLAHNLGKPIAVFDLETTTLRGRPNFAITEVACFVVTPQGPGVMVSDLINPERRIDPEAQRLTGITADMVRDKEPWGTRYAGLFVHLSKTCWMSGFNNSSFDEPAVREMNERYGQPIGEFEHSFDVRNLFLRLCPTGNRKGRLPEVAAAFGIAARSALHRASADVVLTLETLDAMVELYGVEVVSAQVRSPGSSRVATADGIARYSKERAQPRIDELLARYTQSTETQVLYEIGKAIDERLVDPRLFADESAQQWLDLALADVDPGLIAQGRLKPLLQEVGGAEDIRIDYVQLRIALLNRGHTWASLKPL